MDVKRLREYCIVIPAYRAADRLPSLVKRIFETISGIHVFIINDGSQAGDYAFVEQDPDITVIHHETNLGKGAALKTGLKAARRQNYRFAVCLDADLQHEPQKIIDFIRMRETQDSQLVLGRRNFSHPIMPLHRILSNTITSLLISLRTGKRIHDSQCGYRLIDLEGICIDRLQEDGFQLESEFLLKALPANIRYSELNIPTIYNKSGSSINNLKDTVKFIILFLRSYLWI